MNRMIHIAPVAIAWALLASCTLAVQPMTRYLQRPSDVEVVAAQDRTLNSGLAIDERFGLGEYRVDKVDRLGDPRWQTSADVERRKHTEKYYAFEMRGPSELDGACAVRGFSHPATRRELECRCYEGADEVARLSLGSDLRAEPLIGSVTIGGQEWPLRSYGELDRTAGDLRSAFEVGAPLVMAVGMALPGEVWLTPQLAQDARGPTLCVSAALMLYRRRDVAYLSPSPGDTGGMADIDGL